MEDEEYDLKHFETFLGESNSEGGHWDKIKKRTATLFQVLIDGDLKELVFVLKHYPQYTELVCEHFRYLYNYSEQSADIFAASKLLYMSEAYHQKQFVRNLLRKLEKIETYELSQIKTFLLFWWRTKSACIRSSSVTTKRRLWRSSKVETTICCSKKSSKKSF